MEHRAPSTPLAPSAYAVSLYVLPGSAVVVDACGDASALVELLEPPERARAARFVRATDRDTFVTAHALLRIAVAHHLGVPLDHPRFDFTCSRCGEQHGAPRLLGSASASASAAPAEGVAVSLSRSSGAIAVAVLADPPHGAAAPGALDEWVERTVGVDLERIDAVGFAGFDEVALAVDEQEWFEPGDLRARAALWARKEAVAKALGTGLRTDPRDIPTSAVRLAREATAHTYAGGRGAWPHCDAEVALTDPRLAAFCAAVAVAPAAPADSITCVVIDAGPLVALALAR